MAVSSAMKARPFSVAADARQFVKRFMSSEITDASCLFAFFVCLFTRKLSKIIAVHSAMKARHFRIAADYRRFIKRFMA